jgi:hypothetical protein
MKTAQADISSAAAKPAPSAAAPPKTVEQLRAESEALREQLAQARAELNAYHATRDADEAEEILIVAKMQIGLNRKQAMLAIRRQREFDNSDYGKMCKARHLARQSFKAFS